ncbi:hypothetical protein HPB51_017002 [Rhipicephalus microplus]|uniref:Uncharacterized protein n=1 Tax=Rhipicephalus microplus TaxID=6941 RepID=A0A9J6F5P2_RHIMP|nr:hypothetical protein HPB51_017002 [Rhipicephalus microplus]
MAGALDFLGRRLLRTRWLNGTGPTPLSLSVTGCDALMGEHSFSCSIWTKHTKANTWTLIERPATSESSMLQLKPMRWMFRLMLLLKKLELPGEQVSSLTPFSGLTPENEPFKRSDTREKALPVTGFATTTKMSLNVLFSVLTVQAIDFPDASAVISKRTPLYSAYAVVFVKPWSSHSTAD